MLAAEGILTARGGLVSHAAVVARGWGKPAVVGAEALRISASSFAVGDTVVNEGDWISVDGTNGTVMLGQVPVTEGETPARVRDHPGLGRPGPGRPPRGAGQCRQRAGRRQRPPSRGRRDRPVPHRAHVPGRRPTAHRPSDDPGRHSVRGGGGPRGAPGGPAVGLRGDPRGHGRPPGHHPASRSSAPRVPARHPGAGREGGHDRSDRGGEPPLRGGQDLARVQPDAGNPGGAPRGDQAGSVRHAGPGPDGGGHRPGGGRRSPDRGDHDPADRLPRGAGPGPLVGRGGHRRGRGRHGGDP